MSYPALAYWAAGLTPVYLEGALGRALALAAESTVIARLDRAEYEALEDAERLQAAAEIGRTTAAIDEAAASMAREDADEIRRQRLASEAALAATEEAAANLEANAHEEAARDARVAARKAGQRRQDAQTEAARRPRHRRGQTGQRKNR